MSAPSLVSIIRAERAAGTTLRQIASDLGVSNSLVFKIAKRHNIKPTTELRGGWRGGVRRRKPDPRGKSRDSLPSIDTEKAQSITDGIRKFWGVA